MKWRSMGEIPVAIKAVIVLFLANCIAETWLFLTIRDWARAIPDAEHSHILRLKGGAAYFVQPWLGKYLDDGLPLGFVLLAVLLLMFWLYRDQLERYR